MLKVLQAAKVVKLCMVAGAWTSYGVLMVVERQHWVAVAFDMALGSVGIRLSSSSLTNFSLFSSLLL